MKQARRSSKTGDHRNGRLRGAGKGAHLVGYMRVCKADGTQVLDLQRDALVAAGVPERGVAAQICDRIAVMQDGEVVEQGDAADVFARPRHAYTQELLASVPGRGWRHAETT